MKRYAIIGLMTLTGIIRLSAQDVSQKAIAFLNAVASLKVQSQYPLDDQERFNWAFVPLARKGPTFHDFNETQKAAALELLSASLSAQGYQKAAAIINNEVTLREIEGLEANSTYRDPLNYHFTIFGTPSPDKAWGWRFEGHHCSFNFAFSKNELVSSTPSFFGANPGIVMKGAEKGREILKLETDLGYKLIQSMNENQLKQARFSETALPEIVSSNKRKAEILTPAGIKIMSFNEEQKKTFMQLLTVFVRNYEFGFSNKLMDKIKSAGLDNLSFAWAGSLTPGEAHYYRIQGPMLLIEYDNTQNNANHVHTAVRDLNNDFAEDILREHYRKEH